MTTTSTTIMPPILEYSYPSFPYFKLKYDFIIKMSVINDYDSFDYIELRAVMASSNDEGFNPSNAWVKTLDQSNYFAKIFKNTVTPSSKFGSFEKTSATSSNDSRLTIHLNPFDSSATEDGTASIFNIYTSNEPSPTNFKLQCRLGKTSPDEVSEWSNAAIIRVNNGIVLGITPDVTSPVTQTSILWNGTYSATGPTNNDEVVNQYRFTLSRNNEIIEDSYDITVGAYELPNYQYRFRTPLENTTENGISNPYSLAFHISTNYGYEDTLVKNIEVAVPYQRTYDIFNVQSNDEEAYNAITIEAKERFVRHTNDTVVNSNNYISDTEVSQYFLKDASMATFAPEAAQTHLRLVPLNSTITSAKLIPDYDMDKKTSKFQTSNNDTVSILLAITNIKISTTKEDALADNNLLFRINNTAGTKNTDQTSNQINAVTETKISDNALDIKVGAYQKDINNQYLLIQETLYGLINNYTLKVNFSAGELFFVLKKNALKGDLTFEAATGATKWIVNNFS